MPAFDDIKWLFERICSQNNEPNPRPGLDRDLVARRLADNEFAPHPLLLDLYSWHDGVMHLNAFLHFLPLEEAIEISRMMRERDPSWQTGWFPGLNINGDLAISLDVDSNQILVEDVEGGERWLLANHYQNYLDALRHAFQSGAAEFDEIAGSFGVAEGAWTAIAKQHQVSDW
jgi:hypothetical protein